MKRLSLTRAIALMVLLLHGGAFGAAAVFDAFIAARANAAVAHVEGTADTTCAAHDESTCQLCRVAGTTLCGTTQAIATVPFVRAARPTGNAGAGHSTVTSGALHSRAPPAA